MRGMTFREPLLWERSRAGRDGYSLSKDFDEASVDAAVPAELKRKVPAELPEVSEPEMVRHYVRLSHHNYCVDTGMFPLGSCTMKYNPKVNEWAARLPGFVARHPYAPESQLQGAIELIALMEGMLAEIAGLDAVSLQPAAGAQGEFLGLAVIRGYLTDRGNPRKKVIIPDSAHGTNPATCTLNGYKVLPLKSGPQGTVDPAEVARVMNDEVAGIMITNPNTLGVFERDIHKIVEVVHAKGGQVYMDGANMNALCGVLQPGATGIDVMHFNLHKTMSIPHGGGGPGSGPIAVRKHLEPYLPAPRAKRKADGTFSLDYDRPKSVGRVKAWYGNYGCLVRGYAYLREYGPEGVRKVTELAVLNANYVRAGLKEHFALASESPSMHEVVFSDANLKGTEVQTLDIAKRIMDYGYHPPTMYFPLIVHGSLMIEPTESETKETLDAFIHSLKAIAEEAKTSPEIVRSAPHVPGWRRFDEARAARNPVLRWKKDRSSSDG
ncbi:MAG: aminomethyl-transferring glycine dehydrogenase subunit GcvPB [Deltaproteobacteria bacterium]|nr:aminomethyl-transferring glycine dehydrogenase subunit GcvPB [Deltaproteobacteria bacterium]